MNRPPDDFSQPNPFLIPPVDPFAASRGGANPPADVNPYMLPPGGPSSAHIGGRTSATAIISLIMGLLSFPLLCACGVSIVPSLLGIVLGHVSRAKVRNSAGQLMGGGMALAGLMLSYISLLLLIGLWTVPFAFRAMLPEGDQVASSYTRSALDVAESKIQTDTYGIGHGNTPRAEELAKAFAEAMEQFDRDEFEQSGRSRRLTGGHYLTYCELHGDSCAFVTQVPNYRKFGSEAKEFLAEGAWRIAQETVRNELPPDARLAVGLRGIVLYGAVMIGQVGEEGDSPDPEFQGDDEDRLEAFMESQQPLAESAIDLEQSTIDDDAEEVVDPGFDVESDMEAEAEVESESAFEDDLDGDASTESDDNSHPEETEEENPFESTDEAGEVKPEASDDEADPFKTEGADESKPANDEENPFE